MALCTLHLSTGYMQLAVKRNKLAAYNGANPDVQSLNSTNSTRLKIVISFS